MSGNTKRKRQAPESLYNSSMKYGRKEYRHGKIPNKTN